MRLMCVAAAMGTAGCGQFYSGGINLGQNRKSMQAYHEFLRQRDLAARPGPTAQPEAVVASSPGRPILPAPSTAPAVDVAFAGNPASPSPRPADAQPPARVQAPLRTSPLNGSDTVARVSFAPEGGDFDCAVDPTGRWLAFASTRHRTTADIYLKTVTGTTLTQITSDPADDVMPTFSPDGKRLAFASNRSGNWDIYVTDIVGGQSVQLTNDPADELHPSFSPDGRQLVYCAFGSQSGQWEMVVVDVDSPGTRRFIGYGMFPDWSPVEDKIVFQRARERGTRWFSVWTVSLVNGEATHPTEVVASANAAAITPAWSPDGRHLAFATVLDPDRGDPYRPGQADVWITSMDGTGRANLTNSQFANLQPCWSRDGSIFFVSNRGNGGVENIWSVRPERALQVAGSLSGGQVRQADAMPPLVDRTAQVPVK